MSDAEVLFGNPGGPQATIKVHDKMIRTENIEYTHERIHDGHSFVATYSNAVTNTNEKTALQWLFGGTADKEMHVTFDVEALKNTTVTFYKAPVTLLNSNSSTVTIVSRNQANPGTANAKTYATAPIVGISAYNEGSAVAGTVTSSTVLDSFVLSGGEGPKSLGAQRRDSSEWVLGGTVSTLYSLVMNAETDDDDTHYIRMDWYEQDSD